jgi:hypothetical protein
MATTTNYGWETPDDTDLVKDGASAIRTLGSSIDTTTKALNPSTTLGDIEYRSATANTNTRLAIGTAGQVLTVNSGATAPEWASPAGASENFTLINTGGTALTGATTITVSGISGKNALFIWIDGASSVNTEAAFQLRFNTDTGNNYSNVRFEGNGVSPNTLNTANNNNVTVIPIGTSGNNAADTVSAFVQVRGTNSSGLKIGSMVANANNKNSSVTSNGIFSYKGTSTISSVSLVSNNGNFDAGTIYVYGA